MKKRSQSLWLAMTVAVLLISTGSMNAQTTREFAPDKMDTILYGAAYYPEYMPYERLEQDWRAQDYSEEMLEKIFYRNAEAFFHSIGRTPPGA